jgi:alanine racemase
MKAASKRRSRDAVHAGASPSQSLLTIDLRAIAANYRTLRRHAGKAACAAVIKADAYGLGAVQVAPALAAAGCRHFFVAHVGEAVAVRRALRSPAAIYVLNGVLAGEETALRRHGFIPVLNDPGQVERWALAAHRGRQHLPAVLHVDTGMSRLGLSVSDAARLAASPGRLAGIDLRYVMTHLACAEDDEHPLNSEQRDALIRVRAAFPRVRASLANSAGIFLGPAYHFDLVRPGSALFGINPRPGRANRLRQVVRLDGKILQIHEVDPPKSVGYGATHRVARRTRIATVAVGYADGWPRSLSNRGSAFIGEVRVPIIGRVSMDLMTLDITSAPPVAPGDTVELMGDRLPVDEVAAAAGTIGYEILTRLGSRYHRAYVGSATSLR